MRILPAISQILEGDALLIRTRSIDPQDLLGRNPVVVNLKQTLLPVGKAGPVTGMDGPIDRELCGQLLSGENSIYQIDREPCLLQEEGVGEKVMHVSVTGDLKDAVNMNFGTARGRHSVACLRLQHVPMVEENPVAAIENNVPATEKLIRTARMHLCFKNKLNFPAQAQGVGYLEIIR